MNDTQFRTISKTGQIFGYFAFTWVMLDALTNYFLRTYTGSLLAVNSLLPFFILCIVIIWGIRTCIPPANINWALGLGTIGFLSAIIFVNDVEPHRALELAGSLCAFIVGYFCIRWAHDEVYFSRVLLFSVGFYVVVCVVALLQIAPNWFPIINAQWAFKGSIEQRPEIMTDQNFQVFYLFPILLVLALPYRFWRFWLAFGVAVGGLFVLSQVQTRSGMLVYLGTLGLSLLAPLWNSALGRKKILILPLFGVVLIMFNMDIILNIGKLMIIRFTETDYNTGYGRVLSITYLFEHILDVSWWIPHGYEDFKRLYGNSIPHSNGTAMFLEGGILGIYMWIVVFIVPLYRLTRKFFQKRIDLLSTMVLLGGLSCLITELSLNVPFFKQPWLWAGAVVGALRRVEHRRMFRSLPADSSLQLNRYKLTMPGDRKQHQHEKAIT